MNNCKALFNFIPYFEDPIVVQLGYRQQDDEITAFVDEVYQCGILNKNYFQAIQEWAPGGDYPSLIADADFEQIRLLMSYYVCQQNFSTTLWEEPIKEKIFLRLLMRLRNFIGEDNK